MLTYVSDTEISPQNNIIKIQRVDISLHQVFLNYLKLPLFSWNLTTAFLHIVSITDASSLGVNISKRAMTTCFPCFSILSVVKNCVCEQYSFWILYLPILEIDLGILSLCRMTCSQHSVCAAVARGTSRWLEIDLGILSLCRMTCSQHSVCAAVARGTSRWLLQLVYKVGSAVSHFNIF